MAAKMGFITVNVVIFSLLYGICLGEVPTLKKHAVQWEHQEMVFGKLIQDYNARLRPFATQNTPVGVNISIFLYSVSSVDDLKTDITMQILYRETWFDERLKFTPDDNVQKIFGDAWHADRIWTPIVHVVNDNELSEKNDGKVLVHINPDGKILLSKRKKLRPFCNMEFYRYPMDKQQCTLEIESSILPSNDLILKWADDRPMDLNQNFIVAGFSLSNYTLEEKITVYPETGNFSRIVVSFELERQFAHFLMDIYIPSTLFVVTSWLSLWVEIPAAPARVALGITSMLTLVTSTKAVRDKLPKVSYVHALDVWNVVCTGFVFATLAEYALVNYIYHKDKRSRKSKALTRAESASTFYTKEDDLTSAISLPRIYSRSKSSENSSKKIYSRSVSSLAETQSTISQMDISCGWPLDGIKLTPQDIANGIDRKCRYIFLLGFIIFNVIYWLVLWL